jgi:hypothetical protein
MQNVELIPIEPTSDEPSRHRRRWYQFSIRALFVVTTATAVLLWAVWIAWPSWREYRLAQSLRREVLAARDSAEKGEAYQAMIGQLQPQTLKRLEHDPDDGIALKAVYGSSTVCRDPWTPLAAKEAEDFAMLLARRTSLEPPAWWIRVFAKRESFGGPDSAPQIIVTRDGEDLLIERGKERVRVSSPPFKAPSEDEAINAAIATFDSQRAYAAMSPIDGSTFPLVCVAVGTGQILWQSDVWALGFDNVSAWGGPIYHVAEIKVHGDLVAVWGNGIGGSYVEAFDAKTGKNRLRFCTEFWFWDH